MAKLNAFQLVFLGNRLFRVPFQRKHFTLFTPHRPTTDRNQSSHENRRTSNAAPQIQNPSISVSCENPSTDHMAKKKLVFIAGDSIIQHVQGWDLSTNDKHVAVKSFAGARIADMEDYIKPLLRKEPYETINVGKRQNKANRNCHR